MKRAISLVFVLAMMGFAVSAYGQTASPPQGKTPPPPAAKTQDELFDDAGKLGGAILKDIDTLEQQIDTLETRIKSLQSLGDAASEEIAKLRAQIDVLTDRVKELGKRYGTVLTMAQGMKKSLETSTTLNFVLGGTTVVLAGVLVTLFATGNIK